MISLISTWLLYVSRTVTNDFELLYRRNQWFEGECLHAGESRSNAKIQLHTSCNSIGLSLIELYGMFGRMDYVTRKDQHKLCLTDIITTHALSMLLNLARLTSRLGFALIATSLISEPICSPSRSQSVQIYSARAYFA